VPRVVRAEKLQPLAFHGILVRFAT